MLLDETFRCSHFHTLFTYFIVIISSNTSFFLYSGLIGLCIRIYNCKVMLSMSRHGDIQVFRAIITIIIIIITVIIFPSVV